MTQHPTDCLVSTEWLAARLGEPDLRVVDATYYLPTEAGDARAQYEAEHIPGAVFFDIEAIKDPDDPLPHMLPPPAVFAEAVGRLGLGDEEMIVVYDRKGLFSAARVWWSFRVFGHRRVAVLDGGLPKWKAEGRPLDDHPVTPAARSFTPRLDPAQVRSRGDLLRNLQDGREQVLDARSRGRFEGSAPEPRPILRSGHIPDSLNLPYNELLDPDDATLLPPEILRERFAGAGLDPERPVVTTCGSGVTAAVLTLALTCLGRRDLALYDGSWSDWGLPGETPVETGPAKAGG